MMYMIHDMAGEERVEKLFELAVQLTEGLHRELGAMGLTGARAEVLRVLERRGPCNQRDLAGLLRCTPRNVTSLIDALERSGQVLRRAHPTDRRVRLVELTTAGSEIAGVMRSGQASAASSLFADVSPDDLASFDHVVETLLARTRQG